MPIPFFPFPLFAWIYLGVLLSLLAAASYTDLGRMVVPKQVTWTGLALGLAFNVARGALLGAEGLSVWMLGEGGPFLGALDGLLFALAGFGLGFVLFFVMWILGVCGGGDVKLLAAATLWAGPASTPALLVVTGVLGGLLTLVLLFSARLRAAISWARAAAVSSLPVPYGAAIAAAAVIVTLPPNLS